MTRYNPRAVRAVLSVLSLATASCGASVLPTSADAMAAGDGAVACNALVLGAPVAPQVRAGPMTVPPYSARNGMLPDGVFDLRSVEVHGTVARVPAGLAETWQVAGGAVIEMVGQVTGGDVRRSSWASPPGTPTARWTVCGTFSGALPASESVPQLTNTGFRYYHLAAGAMAGTDVADGLVAEYVQR